MSNQLYDIFLMTFRFRQEILFTPSSLLLNQSLDYQISNLYPRLLQQYTMCPICIHPLESFH